MSKKKNLFHYDGSTIISTTAITVVVNANSDLVKLSHLGLKHIGEALTKQSLLKGSKAGKLSFC